MKYICTLILLTYSFHLTAGVYKWVDEKGNVHYGDKPQADVAVPVQIDKVPTQSTADRESRQELRQRVTDSLEEDRLAKQEEREKQKKQREKRLKECNWLKDRQKRYQGAAGLYQLDKDGNRVFLSDDSRKQTEKKLQRQINKACR